MAFDCKLLGPALLVQGFSVPLLHTARSTADTRAILRKGFETGRNPNIFAGVYTFPIVWVEPQGPPKNLLDVRLKMDAVFLETGAERPMDAIHGMGSKAWNAAWVYVLNSMGYEFALAKKKDDVAWYRKHQDQIDYFFEGPGDEHRWKERQQYVRGMENLLKRCKVDALIQGGELIILNTKKIASVRKLDGELIIKEFDELEKSGEVPPFGPAPKRLRSTRKVM